RTSASDPAPAAVAWTWLVADIAHARLEPEVREHLEQRLQARPVRAPADDGPARPPLERHPVQPGAEAVAHPSADDDRAVPLVQNVWIGHAPTVPVRAGRVITPRAVHPG